MSNHNQTYRKISIDKTYIAIKISAYLSGGRELNIILKLELSPISIVLNEIFELKYLENY